MRAAVRRVESLLVEERGQRSRSSLCDLADLGGFFTIDDPFIQRAEAFLGSLPADSSLAQVLSTFGAESNVLPDGQLLVSRPGGVLADMFYADWQVSEVWVKEQELRITAHWTPRTDRTIWLDDPSLERFWPMREGGSMHEAISAHCERSESRRPGFEVPLENVPFNGLTDYDGIRLSGQVLMSPANGWIAEIGGLERLQKFSTPSRVLFYFLLWKIYIQGPRTAYDPYSDRLPSVNEIVESRLTPALQRLGWLEPKERAELLQCLPKRPLRLFSTQLGARRLF